MTFINTLCISVGVLACKLNAQMYILNPDNGHYYTAVLSSGVSWTDASSQANQMSYLGSTGYLATVTSENENNFLVQNFFTTFETAKISFAAQALIGGIQNPIGELNPLNGWRWEHDGSTFPGVNGVTGLDNVYSNWAQASDAVGDPYYSTEYHGEPNDAGGGFGSEQFAALFRFSNAPGRWNDSAGYTGDSSVAGYIVEITPIPEPESYAAFAGLSLIAFAVYRRHRK